MHVMERLARVSRHEQGTSRSGDLSHLGHPARVRRSGGGPPGAAASVAGADQIVGDDQDADAVDPPHARDHRSTDELLTILLDEERSHDN